jgi:hypothetical protein
MRIPERIYGYGQVAVPIGDDTAHRVNLVVVGDDADVARWKGRIMSTGGNGRYVRYGVACITNDNDQPPVACYSAQWAAEVVGITEACTTCWSDEEAV